MMNKITDPLLGCFCLKPEYVSIGFGFSTSYCDNRSRPLFSVCKTKDWMNANEHESFCTMALHESMCPHTTHFKSGPILRVQSNIEALNCITDRQCGSGKPLYSPIGFSALNKVASGEVNISAILEGFNKDFRRVDIAMRTLHEHPRNRTEIQVRCIVDSAGNMQWNSMIQAAAKVSLVPLSIGRSTTFCHFQVSTPPQCFLSHSNHHDGLCIKNQKTGFSRLSTGPQENSIYRLISLGLGFRV